MSRGVLELEIGKFVFRFPEDLRYSEAGIWARFEGRRVRIGLSDFAQQRNGDVTFAEPREPGTLVRAGDEVALVETIKVNFSVPSPVAGKIVEINGALEASPELVNQDPYKKGWIAVLELEENDAGRSALLTAESFLALAKSQAEGEASR